MIHQGFDRFSSPQSAEKVTTNNISLRNPEIEDVSESLMDFCEASSFILKDKLLVLLCSYITASKSAICLYKLDNGGIFKICINLIYRELLFFIGQKRKALLRAFL
ncbi:hypothetical protein BAMY_03090 [Bacillus amyloliquefaciens]|nr:hypothetical protein BAMY_03090 [Bacillus amyloliquefaciens]AWM82151.1 hypothetical protein B7L90_02190 [Bacillus velezensis]KDN93946.1 hypothetical protein EF87_04055 [Bacillus amyloliquefaciens]PAE31938.1 hypothetical protein CHI00_17940 [Bacillus velezensis]